ncbi:ABC transporter ATP-binding protein [Paenarthrobacter ureafaciens]|uniref:ABC transporter ATP-binding protein n=1 Tax=Paenarthrobacter ureafaciens TaxID=37931 RepID=UPI0009ADF98A|nr:ABC transporter ATP-binding protein [Paenarthrobacter ureafaciens]GLU61260.1 multidrug ABC transporter ATP-binding protein [Paenarthrobacter ureafaciens]GLU65539.1 multidrug ABC transporter ATP-binding protein [Paenarthrobacter ureafaciens]GLU69668.1 multidrug ABC transporter ATP-binding protein [Paenarthrobacter ureafaciens]GLU74090.1 multidrug ABC transporter ATP-binding protein [Paenarthrobacter ureafaciens]GLU78331.1 multidrug ABC transporter ATP-binding protein [Paenarthrobacter ureafa
MTTAVRGPQRPPMGPGRGGPFAGMNVPAEKASNFGASAKRLLGTLHPERVWLGLVLMFAVVSVALNVIGPRLLGEGTNLIFAGVVSKELPAGVSKEAVIAGLRAAGENTKADMLSAMPLTPGVGIDFGALSSVLIWTLVLYVLAAAFGWIQAYILNGVVQRTVYRLRERIEAKIHRLPLKYFDKIQRGELLSRVTNDVDNISQSLQQSISQVVSSLLTVLGVLVMMFILSPLLALIALITIPLTLGITVLIAKRSQKLFVAQWKNTGELNGHIEETYTGHALVKVFGRQDEVQQKFRDKNSELFQASFGAQFVSGLIMPAMTFIGNLVYVAIAVVGGLQVASGGMQLGDVQAFIQYSRQFTMPLAQLGSMANMLQSGVASAERVFELLDEEEESPEPPDTSAAGGPGRLVFEDVSFSYSPDKPLITGLNLVAEPGQSIAIVGPTGAGKTTLVNLMMRFYELDGGRITLDGVDISTMSRQELRSRMGMVLQDTWLFGGTIRDNIAYGRPDASEASIVEAAQATYVDRFVRSLPEGYNTLLDDEGSNVSAGEKQLLTIARAFLSRPSVLILDEATSSVDTRTEVLVQKAMNALRSDRTSFVIAHRLSTIRDADLILVMESGQIVEQGTHSELLSAGGAYSRLYEAQFAAPAAEV